MTSTFSTNKTQYDIGEIIYLSFPAPLEADHRLKYQVGTMYSYLNISEGAEQYYFYANVFLLSSSAFLESDTAPMTLTLSSEEGPDRVKTITLHCPSSLGPTVSGGYAEPVSQAVPADWGIYVAGMSQARITLDQAAEPFYLSPIDSYSISGCGASAQSASLPLTALTDPLNAGENVITITATDRRGGVGVQELTLSAVPYAPPALSGILTLRCLEDGTEDDEGTFAKARAFVSFSSCQGHNAASCRVAYRRQGAEQWTDAGELTNGQLIFGGQLALSDNYEIRYTVTDSLGSQAVSYDVVTRAIWEMHVKRGGGAWAFGGVADIDGTLKIYGDLQVLGTVRASAYQTDNTN